MQKRYKKKIGKCMYCLEEKPIKDFNKDHVIPKAFGKFGTNNFTLVNLVCRVCNQYFGNNIENDLARDSLYGIVYRTSSGIIDSKEYFKNKKHKKNFSQAYVVNNLNENILVDILNYDNSSQEFLISLANQVIFMNSTKGVKINFEINKMPHRRYLEDIGLKPDYGYLKLYLKDDSEYLMNMVQEAFNNSNIIIAVKKMLLFETTFQERNQFLKFNFRLNDWIMRAIAKMAFNYFIIQYGNIAYGKNFDDIRNYIRYGNTPNYFIIQPILNKNIYHITQRNIIKNIGHIIIIKQEKQYQVTAYISLFNTHVYEILLCKKYFLLLPKKGSFFDIKNKMVSIYTTYQDIIK